MAHHPTVAVAPGALPGLGHLARFVRAPLAFVRTLPAHGELVEIRLGSTRLVVVCDPELTRTLLLHDRVFDKGGPLYRRLREVGGTGLATCPAAEHRQRRRLVQPAFHQRHFPGYARIMADRTDAMISSWPEGRTVDLTRETRRITADALVATVFGADLDPAVHSSLAADLHELMAGVFRRSLLPEPLCRLPTLGNRRHARAASHARRTMGELIAGYRARKSCSDASDASDNPDASGGYGDGLLSLLLSARTPDGSGAFSDEELIDHAVTFYVAGTETTAGAVCWAVRFSTLHPHVHRRLTEEIATVLGGRTATWDDLPRLEYTRRTLTETLRLCPPGWFLTRQAEEDTRLGGYFLPRGTTLAYSPYLLHHLPGEHADPDTFDPDRWRPGPGDSAPSPLFLAFGAGARRCIGDEFALLQGTLLLASILSHGDLRLRPGGRPLPRLPQLTLNPGPLPARLVRATP
ncbi:cytochrome P450 [Streptomyces yaizuensis]|uniref:Cytochrome P450 n=1 Tax=Streptomyces yaizuensis TaxID=2989713 RepID=A0ABQ5PBX6_9ACTN|nr:cytochrome P450 [Streptomyces sp. YSPA8]GLF99891.1 cytochrome P450 [Streptomyces sp. YSPA8]